MSTLVRIDRTLVSEGMFLRPRRPDDHREFEVLLPQLTPLFVYADEDGRDWVRWSMPNEVARRFGMENMQCDCCNNTHPSPGEHSFTIDTAFDEVDWFLNRTS